MLDASHFSLLISSTMMKMMVPTDSSCNQQDDDLIINSSCSAGLQWSDFFMGVDWILFLEHVAWTKSGKDIKAYATRTFAAATILLSVLVGIQLLFLFSSSSELGSSARDALLTSDYTNPLYYMGLLCILSSLLTGLSIGTTVTFWKLIDAVSDNNAYCMLRSSMGQFVWGVVDRLIRTALVLFFAWTVLGMCVLLRGPVLVVMLAFVLTFTIVAKTTVSAFARLILESGAMSDKKLFHTDYERTLVPSALHAALELKISQRQSTIIPQPQQQQQDDSLSDSCTDYVSGFARSSFVDSETTQHWDNDNTRSSVHQSVSNSTATSEPCLLSEPERAATNNLMDPIQIDPPVLLNPADNTEALELKEEKTSPTDPDNEQMSDSSSDESSENEERSKKEQQQRQQQQHSVRQQPPEPPPAAELTAVDTLLLQYGGTAEISSPKKRAFDLLRQQSSQRSSKHARQQFKNEWTREESIRRIYDEAPLPPFILANDSEVEVSVSTITTKRQGAIRRMLASLKRPKPILQKASSRLSSSSISSSGSELFEPVVDYWAGTLADVEAGGERQYLLSDKKSRASASSKPSI
jgi:hypothetical protein